MEISLTRQNIHIRVIIIIIKQCEQVERVDECIPLSAGSDACVDKPLKNLG